MNRKTDLESVKFPVELRDISIPVPSGPSMGGEHQLFKFVPGYKAVVESNTDEVFSVVSKKYSLITNKTAIKWGTEIFKKIFSSLPSVEFEVFNIVLSKSRAACHIDLIHPSYQTSTWKQETWLPFLRISNSYNKSRALSFDFGFVRKLCSNGIIFDVNTAQLKFYHTSSKIKSELDLNKYTELKTLEEEFLNYMQGLKETPVTTDQLVPLTLYLMNVDLSQKKKEGQKQEDQRLRAIGKLHELQCKYTNEMGCTAYTAMNIATDISTHHPRIISPLANLHHLQSQIGKNSRTLVNLLAKSSDRTGAITSLTKSYLLS